MTTIPLPPPPAELARLSIATVQIDPSAWCRISQFTSGEPYFGRSGGNRFDDPNPNPALRFGTLYLGAMLEVAVAETLLHNAMPQLMRFGVSESGVAMRQVVRFVDTRPLTLVDLTGRELKKLVGSGELTTVTPYDLPQAWAQALHGHPAAFDGLLYQSRHINTHQAAVVFHRAAPKLGRARYAPLIDDPDWPAVQDGLGMDYRYP
jgi:hypothetical protein